MPEMHLRQPGASEPFTKIKKWIQKLKKKQGIHNIFIKMN